MSRPGQHLRLLVVEDNPGDLRLIREALAASPEIEFNAVTDGVEAMRYLRRQDGYHDARSPDLILLDLNLPKLDGRDVLAEIKRDPLLRRIPVVVLTTSGAEEEIERCYDLHAATFIRKPGDYGCFMDTLQSILRYWSSTASLPRGSGGR